MNGIDYLYCNINIEKLLFFALIAVTTISFNASSKDDDGPKIWTDDSPIIEFEDPYFLEALLSHDINGDHQISKKEAGIALYLDVSNSYIRGMEEIGYFTALEVLYCNNNQLTSLDLSKNTALEVLGCNYNQLTSLDLSKNTALEVLGCNYNQLTSLDLSNDTALEMLYCNNNQLTSLDLSNDTALEMLYCHDNQLTSLDLSKNTALEVLYCNNNQLTILDVSKCKQLVQLTCYGNKNLQSVIVSQYHLMELNPDLNEIVREYGDIITYR